MKRTPVELAAIASAAVPGLSPTAVTGDADDTADFDSALIIDSEKRRWRVRSPKHIEASTRLESERQVLRIFSANVRANLPFLLPTVAGTVRVGELTTFVYSHVSGKVEPIEVLLSGRATLGKEIGLALAAIHSLDADIVTSADLPSYTANEFRQRKLNELDQAATTGKIPSELLRRWEHALEDVALWRFSPTVVHGDFHEDNLVVHDGKLVAVTGWTDVRFADPADDFAWLTAIDDAEFVDTVVESYSAARGSDVDPHLMRRAALSAEFALAQWLVRAVNGTDPAVIADAEDMLMTLDSDIREHGGQKISIDPPTVAPQVSASVTVSAVSDEGDSDTPKPAPQTRAQAAAHHGTETTSIPVQASPEAESVDEEPASNKATDPS